MSGGGEGAVGDTGFLHSGTLSGRRRLARRDSPVPGGAVGMDAPASTRVTQTDRSARGKDAHRQRGQCARLERLPDWIPPRLGEMQSLWTRVPKPEPH